ncbi:TldD/PmbA family protein [Granulicella mallensis]|uniref:Peptidase U62 modulator of DNA gyrase n=1 Tax=Granulicella mallensis (strain ATCC BAA-1857 / DSM 23137 / MP5ACTX8) TaxID=682795 RepID=G8NUK2_GRAMM|nr:metallopeptidase TldD-related protein [Granulicella mallensis]AEU36453.1 peptidase U62 modulator of DNA gyrase [Granulicella mallensis MP5ACTX8]
MKTLSLLRAISCPCLVAAFLSCTGTAQTARSGSVSPVLSAAKTELDRDFAELKKQPVAPYYLSYEIIDSNTATVSSSFGALVHSGSAHRRTAHIDVRVGDYALDNTHQVRGKGPSLGASGISSVVIPVDDDPLPIRSALWIETDKRYKRALTQLSAVQTNNQVKVEQEDKSDDFSHEKPEQAVEPIPEVTVDRKLWEEKTRKYTAPFHRYGDLFNATAILTADQEARWFVSSDGSMIQTSTTYYRLFIEATSKAPDGMELPRYESFAALTPQGLPDDATVLKAVDKMIADLKALRAAPIVDPYTGPAILSGRATAVFFHEVFGHRIEGHRQKNEAEGQTFKKMVGQQVLPSFLSVDFDPTIKRYGGVDLVGSYTFDDEGVRARPVVSVKDGVLENFLMGRSPIEGFPNSNGHGRAQAGFEPVARQSNLVIVNSKPVSREELKKLLIAQIKEQNKPFGLYFDDIQGGFTLTGRSIPNAFNVQPIMVYRIYPDGREELVRGVDLVGTPLTVFSKILAADDEKAVFNGICGAESGQVPVSASGPGILISQIEVQKKAKSQERPPILPVPFAAAQGGAR